MASNDVKISYTEDDIKKVQTKPNLYIHSYGERGNFHMFKEAAQNSIDEVIDPGFIAYITKLGEIDDPIKILITYDRMSDRVTIEDSGRGIPEDDFEIDIVCTKLQAGSKFTREQGGNSSGEFGVGITVVNALSSEFSLATYRGDYMHKVSFKNGEKVAEQKELFKKKHKGKRHGTITSFIANPLYLGKGCNLNMDLVKEWLESMSYQVPDNIEFHIEEFEGIVLKERTVIKKKPFSELIMSYVSEGPDMPFKPLSFTNDGSIQETIRKTYLDKNGNVKEKNIEVSKNIHLDFSFAYNTSIMENNYESFCNFTKTDEGGVHVDSVEEVLCRYLQKKTLEDMSEAAKAKIDITKSDVKAGLIMVVNLSTNAQVQFMGNAKNRIQNELLKPVIKELVLDSLTRFFEKEPSKLTTCIRVIKENAKARIEFQKVKSIALKKKVDNFSEYDIPNFIKANNTGNRYRELFCIEGRRSAAGSMVNGRDPATQAIFGFRGNTANPYKCSFSEIMKNEEWRNYVRVLRCGIGKDFDIARLYYQKIIISTDADIDGFGIGAGIAAFHVKHLPQIVEAGKLYKVYPPLYHIDDPDKPFIRNKGERIEIFMKKIVKGYKIRIIESINNSYLNDTLLWEFLYDTVDYRDGMQDLRDFYKVDRELLEIVSAALVKCGAISTDLANPVLRELVLLKREFIRDFSNEIQKKFPEVHFENGYVKGVVNGRLMSVKINQRFVNKIADFVPIYEKYYCRLGVKEKNNPEREMSIIEFLDNTHKLIPAVLSRFKGLGEANADQLWETTLSPENRVLVRLTFGDIERDMEIFNKLKSDKLIYRQQRKKMMEDYVINREDLDN